MNNYLFHTSEFGVSSSGVHLLRSGFEYKTIAWNQVRGVTIERGKELHNWWIILLLGIALMGVGGYLTVRTIDIFMNKEHAGLYVKMALFFLIPGIGLYFVFNALRTGTLLKIKYISGKSDKFSLREIINENRLNELQSLLAEKFS